MSNIYAVPNIFIYSANFLATPNYKILHYLFFLVDKGSFSKITRDDGQSSLYKVSVDALEFYKKTGLKSSSHAYEYLQNSLIEDDLQNFQIVYLTNNNSIQSLRFFTHINYYKGVYDVTFSKDLSEVFDCLAYLKNRPQSEKLDNSRIPDFVKTGKGYFTKLDISKVLHLSSHHHMKIYELLKAHEFKETTNINVSTLAFCLGLFERDQYLSDIESGNHLNIDTLKFKDNSSLRKRLYGNILKPSIIKINRLLGDGWDYNAKFISNTNIELICHCPETRKPVKDSQTKRVTKKNGFHNFNEREYDYDELSKGFLN